jgi:hypothetical protein
VKGRLNPVRDGIKGMKFISGVVYSQFYYPIIKKV